MNNAITLLKLSTSHGKFPMHDLFSPTCLDQDLVYVDKTYYPSDSNDKQGLERFITPAIQSSILTQKFDLLSNMSRLNLHGLNLRVVPPTIGSLSKLTLLDLSHNKLTDLPDAFGLLKHVKQLNLSHNLFTELPDCLFSLKELIHLDVSHNAFDQIPSTIDRLTNLMLLDISYTNIRYLPSEIVGLSMTGINMDHCPHLNSFEIDQRNTHNPPSLAETCARQLIQPILLNLINNKSKRWRKNYEKSIMKRLEKLPKHVIQMLSTPSACTQCGGPYFESCVKRYRMVQRHDDSWVPVEYRMCTAHWNTEEERLLTLFSDKPSFALPRFHKVCQLKLTNDTI